MLLSPVKNTPISDKGTMENASKCWLRYHSHYWQVSIWPQSPFRGIWDVSGIYYTTYCKKTVFVASLQLLGSAASNDNICIHLPASLDTEYVQKSQRVLNKKAPSDTANTLWILNRSNSSSQYATASMPLTTSSQVYSICWGPLYFCNHMTFILHTVHWQKLMSGIKLLNHID